MDVEGERLTAYLCPAGKWTIGVGHTGPEAKPGITISRAESRRLLVADIAKAASAVIKGIDVPLSGPQLDALIALAFNIGDENFRTSTVRRVINAMKFDAVPAAFRLFNKITVEGKKVVSKGLVNRREAELSRLWWITVSPPVS